MKIYKYVTYSSFIAFMFFLAFSISLSLRSDRDLLGISWIDKRPSNILGYSYIDNNCFFKINYMANWTERIILEEERKVSFLHSKKICTQAYEYLAQPKMALSVGARVKDDGSWEIIIDHDRRIYNFEDEYMNILR